jgi:hypothetical protein
MRSHRRGHDEIGRRRVVVSVSILSVLVLGWASACGSGSDREGSSAPRDPGRGALEPEAGDLHDRILRFAERAPERRREQRERKPHFRREAPLTPEEQALREAEFEAEQAAALAALDGRSPTERAAAVALIDMDGPGQDRVREMARSEPDPIVRAAAVQRLAYDRSEAGHAVLLEALDDPDTPVLRKVLAALEVVGEASDAPLLDPLIQSHPDPEIRERAEQVKDFLE